MLHVMVESCLLNAPVFSMPPSKGVFGGATMVSLLPPSPCRSRSMSEGFSSSRPSALSLNSHSQPPLMFWLPSSRLTACENVTVTTLFTMEYSPSSTPFWAVILPAASVTVKYRESSV